MSLRERLQLSDVDTHNLKQLAALFVGVIASLYAVGFVSWKIFGVAAGSPTGLIHSIYDRWDVLNYMLIARDGYGSEYHFVNWFPPVPVVMRTAIWAGISPLYTATFVVLVLALVTVLVMYLLVRLDHGPELSRNAALYLMIFPPAFFLYVPYNEAFLLVSVVTSFYFARRRMWPLAGMAAAVASGTRVPGVLIGVGLAVEYASSIDWNWRNVRTNVLWLALTPVGLFVYMTYLYFAVDDPIAFYTRVHDIPHAETIAAHSGLTHFIPSILQDIRTIWITRSINEFTLNVTGLAGLVYWGCALAAMVWLRMRASYIAYSAIIMAPALWVGRLDALNRYALPAFPMFIAVAILTDRYPNLRYPYLAASLGLLYVTGGLFAAYYLPG
jgi:hypothetical protein